MIDHRVSVVQWEGGVILLRLERGPIWMLRKITMVGSVVASLQQRMTWARKLESEPIYYLRVLASLEEAEAEDLDIAAAEEY